MDKSCLCFNPKFSVGWLKYSVALAVSSLNKFGDYMMENSTRMFETTAKQKCAVELMRLSRRRGLINANRASSFAALRLNRLTH